MGCDNCDEAMVPYEALGLPMCYVRIGASNVLLVGCRDHLREAMSLLQAGYATREMTNAVEATNATPTPTSS